MATVRFDTRFPGYEVLSELGRSNARILKARHLATGDLVAIKHFALNTDAETLRRFQRESAIMTSIAHPNIVKVREVQLEAELPYIVMELIEGGSLKSLITGQHRLSIPTVIRLGLQMSEAFKAIHPQGIVHRDIKPENILFRPLASGELHFLLTDFGVARLHEQSSTLTGQSLMTYEYASPEQFNDPKAVNTATDYYSLGVVLYECLHGSVPFALSDHSGIVTFMNKVLNDAPPALTISNQDPTLVPFTELLQNLLQKKASERLSDPDELTWQLKQAELNYLQVSRTGFAPRTTVPTPNVPVVDVEAPKPNVTAPLPPEVRAETPAPAPLPPRSSSGGGWKWAVLALVVLLAGAGLYYAFTKPGAEPGTQPTQTARPTADSTAAPTETAEATESDADTDTPVVPEVDTMQQRLEAEAKRREQVRTQAQAAARSLNAEVIDYSVGLLGGIRNVRVQLDNPSDITFPSIAVQISYYKDNGGLYTTQKIFFNNVKPNSSRIQKAPSSDRGTRVTCKILKYDLPKELDSSMNLVPIDSIN
ncbi:serine/threonine protein kinase [Larkinella insperata]|uniref:Serine/threonine protein kinase n=1 Tax=Larkinella insperata TaxID=332158 RepID=A0ABW3Q9Z3_9BACT|nr:serine/threonine-protein kinase [Larkinella insperata]